MWRHVKENKLISLNFTDYFEEKKNQFLVAILKETLFLKIDHLIVNLNEKIFSMQF